MTTQPTEPLETLLAGACHIDERELRSSLRALIENLTGMTYRCLPDQDWTMLYVSASAEDLTGHPVADLLNGRQSYEALILPEDRSTVRDEIDAARAAGRPFQVSYRITDAQGKQRWVWEQGQSIRHADGREVLEGYIVDVSAERQRAARSEEAMRLERVGLLSASLLHDVNNLMTPLLGHLELLTEELAHLPQSARRHVQNMAAVGERLSALLVSARSMNRAPPASTCIPDDVLADFAAILQRPVSGGLALQLGAPDVVVAASAADIERVVLNLIQNAAEAGASAVTLRTEDVGDDLLITVSDDGRGIPEPLQARVFAPLFTTRPGGSGLGLSTVRQVVEAAGGDVRVHSAAGQGAAFVLRLPSRVEAGERASVILLLEANAFLRQQATAVLAGRGFRVLSCTDNAAALKKLRQGHRPDAVVSDMLLSADREDFLARIRAVRPDMPIHRLSDLLNALG